MKQKLCLDLFIMLVSAVVMILFLMASIHNINSTIEERNNKIISEIHSSIDKLNASHIPSIQQKMYFFPEAVPSLFNLGIKVSFFAIMHLLFAYIFWLMFKKSYYRLEDTFYNWLDQKSAG